MNKVWLITGGTRGIGAALCAHVYEKGDIPITANSFDYDISDPYFAKELVETVIRCNGQIDVLVNNAAIYHRSSVEDEDIGYWNQTIKTNLNGPFYMCHYAIPYMKKQSSAHIINVSSYVAYHSPAERSAYSCSKLALLGFTESLAEEVKKHNIRVNSFSPDKTSTRMDVDGTAEQTPEESAKYLYDLHLCEGTGQYFVNDKLVPWRLQ